MTLSRRSFLGRTAVWVGASLLPAQSVWAHTAQLPRWAGFYGAKEFWLALKSLTWKDVTANPTDEDRRDVIQMLLREIVQSRKYSDGNVARPNFLLTERKYLEQIRANSTPELIDTILQDNSFRKIVAQDTIMPVSWDAVDSILEDVEKLTKMTDEALEKEYTKREAKRLKNNFSILVKNIVGITTDATGYNVTIKAHKISRRVIGIVTDFVWRELPAGTYNGQSFTWKSIIGISGWKINSIAIQADDGKSYEYPRNKGTEYRFDESNI